MFLFPSQNNDHFQKFLYSLEDLINAITCSNLLFYVILGDFNTCSQTWWTDEKTSIEVAQFDAFSSIYELYQLITELIHLIEQSASCIGLTFTNQPSFVTDS